MHAAEMKAVKGDGKMKKRQANYAVREPWCSMACIDIRVHVIRIALTDLRVAGCVAWRLD
jgi:hypothetical protein